MNFKDFDGVSTNIIAVEYWQKINWILFQGLKELMNVINNKRKDEKKYIYSLKCDYAIIDQHFLKNRVSGMLSMSTYFQIF